LTDRSRRPFSRIVTSRCSNLSGEIITKSSWTTCTTQQASLILRATGQAVV
jgi:hypothetical protein